MGKSACGVFPIGSQLFVGGVDAALDEEDHTLLAAFGNGMHRLFEGVHRGHGLSVHFQEQVAVAQPCQCSPTGLFHLAILYPERADLADALKRVQRAGYELEGASDHGVSQALYLRDPDGNGVELYWDRPEQEWPQSEDGTLAMVTERLDLDALLAEAA